MRIKFSHPIPKMLRVKAITLYPYILLYHSRDSESRFYRWTTVKHEMVHYDQVRQYGFIKFYFQYLKEFMVNYFKYKSAAKAYVEISFEKEAYSKEKTALTSYDKLKIKNSIGGTV